MLSASLFGEIKMFLSLHDEGIPPLRNLIPPGKEHIPPGRYYTTTINTIIYLRCSYLIVMKLVCYQVFNRPGVAGAVLSIPL